jgi:hypothetical protein
MNNLVKKTETENVLHLAVENEFTIVTSGEIKQELAASTERSGQESLILTNVSALDVAAIQLAYAWKKALLKQGRQGAVVLPELENIKDLLVKTGITQIL